MCSNCGCNTLTQAAESVSDLKLKKDACCCGATKKTPCICMILGSQCSSVKPMCPCYRLLSVQTKDEKNAEYVGQLTSSQQREIESRLRDALSYLPPEDFEDALENGMDSKIKDLADTIDIEEFFAETFESAVIAKKLPTTPVQKAMLNRAMMEQAEIEHTILDLETKARLGLLDERALMQSLAKKFGAEGAEEIAAYYQDFKEKHPELHETFVLRVANEDSWWGEYRRDKSYQDVQAETAQMLAELGYDFDMIDDYWDAIGYDMNPIYETCPDCEGEGIIITRYYPATRDDPADADYVTCEMCDGEGKILDNPLFEAETKKRKTGFRKCSKCGYSDHNSSNCNRLDEYEAYRKHKDEMLKECDDAIQSFTKKAKRYSEDGEYGLAKMLRSDATDMKKLKRMIENNHFGKAVHFAMSMDSDPRELAPSALWMFDSENEEGSKAFIFAGIAVLSALSIGIYRRFRK